MTDGGGRRLDPETDVRFRLPPAPRYARVARSAAAACASLEGFSIDSLGDVRLLVDELFHALSTIGVGPITIGLEPADGKLGLDMSARRRGAEGWDGPDLALLHTLIDVVTDESQFDVDTDRVGVRVHLSQSSAD